MLIKSFEFQMLCCNFPATWKTMFFNQTTTITAKSPSRPTLLVSHQNFITLDRAILSQNGSIAFQPLYMQIFWDFPLCIKRMHFQITPQIHEDDLVMSVMWSQESCRIQSAGGLQVYQRRR